MFVFPPRTRENDDDDDDDDDGVIVWAGLSPPSPRGEKKFGFDL